MPRVPKHPKSLWRSSPLSGLKIPDNLRLPAEVRHHHRNLLARAQKTSDTVEIAGNVSSVSRVTSRSSKTHSLKQRSQDEESEHKHAESPLQTQRHTKKRKYISEDTVDQNTSLAIASTTVAHDKSPASPTTGPMASSPRSHTAHGLPGDCKELIGIEDQLSDSDNSSEWSSTISSMDSCAQHLDDDDDELPLAEAPLNTTQTALLFPSKQCQDDLHKLCAWLRELLQVEPDSFTVVDPYDFIQVLSFDSLQGEEKSKLDVVIRLRCQISHRKPHDYSSLSVYRKRILIPFHFSGRLLLGHVQMPGLAELYSADLQWVEGPGCRFKDKRTHPIFYIHSFIKSVFPDTGAKTWEWFMPLRTALLQTGLHPGIEYIKSKIDDYPNFHSLMPIYTEVLAMVSGDKPFRDDWTIRAALTRLVQILHVFEWQHVKLEIQTGSGSAATLFKRFKLPLTAARWNADFVKYASPSAGKKDPRSIVENKMEVKKTIREGIAKSRTMAMSLNWQQKEFKDIVDALFHKMRNVVTELRFQYLDRLYEQSSDPMHCQPKKAIGLGGPLQELQLRETARFYDRLRIVQDECERLQKDYDEAIQKLLFVMEEF